RLLRTRGAPRHEVLFLMALRKFLILRRPRSGRLEGRTAIIQEGRDGGQYHGGGIARAVPGGRRDRDRRCARGGELSRAAFADGLVPAIVAARIACAAPRAAALGADRRH